LSLHYLYIYLFTYLFVCLFIYLFIYVKISSFITPKCVSFSHKHCTRGSHYTHCTLPGQHRDWSAGGPSKCRGIKRRIPLLPQRVGSKSLCWVVISFL